MARTFVATSLQRLDLAASPVTGVPFTIALRMKLDSHAGNPYVFSLAHASLSNYFAIAATAAPDNRIRGIHAAGGASSQIFHPTPLTSGVETAVVAVFESDSSRSITHSQLTKATDVTARGTIVPGVLTLGAFRDTVLGPSNYMSGWLADVAMWSVALTDDEQMAYQRGVSPLLIRRHLLAAYWPLVVNDNDYWRNRHTLTPINAPTFTPHTRVVMPSAAPVSLVALGSPWLYYARQRVA